MRPRRSRRLEWMAPLVVAAAVTVTSSIARGQEAATRDSIAAPRAATAAPASPDSAAREEVDADRLRLDGRTSVRLQFLERWPAAWLELPLSSDAWDRPVTLDAGLPLAGWRPAATDRTPVAGFPLHFGMPNAPTAIAAPGSARNDPFLVSRWSGRWGEASPRPLMASPAELLASPRPTLWWEPALLRAARPGATESALLYERGELGLQNVGARFTAPSLGPGMAAAYTRRTSDGIDALLRTTDTRYSTAIMLPRRAALRGWVEGAIAKRRIEDAWIPNPDSSRVRAGESLLDDRSLALHLERRAGTGEQRVVMEVARSRHTGIEVDGVRSRWEEPSWTIGAESRWRPAGGWTWIAGAHARGRDLRYRAGPGLTPIGVLDTGFAETRREARAALALRHESGRRGRTRTWGADVAYDAREAGPGFLDARVHAALEAPRGSVRADLESAHERPSEEDLLLPERDRVFEDVVVLPKPVRYTASGDPSLRPRRLTGAAAAGSWRASNALEFTATGSARRVEDDFGWDLTRSETADTIVVTDRAVLRGSGWSSHGSLGMAARQGPLAFRALAWARGGSSRLSPRAGALPRAGLDASLDGAVKLFRGDLPLRIGVEAELAGRREAPIRAAATAVFNASIRVDFDEAGLYLRLDDLFDRRTPSGLYEISTDAGVPTAGRRFRFGVVWHLLD